YFTLKDAAAQVRCAMFRMKAMRLRFRPADGARVLVRARVSLYEARGEFQLVVEHMEEGGEGALRREFERLKAKLQAEGLFDQAAKRAIPRFPRRVGVLTSPTGAAVRDVLTVLARRNPLVAIDVLPVPVQGAGAAAQIAAMLAAAARSGRYDVLLVTRGGGSLEDLMCFNDEALARAIRAAPVPVVSAIGHEIDFTIADFVADLRAATPSAAAELLAPDLGDVRRELERRAARLSACLDRRLHGLMQRLDALSARLGARGPVGRLALARTRLATLAPRLERALRGAVRERAQRLATLRARHGRCDPRLRLRHQHERLVVLRGRLERCTGAALKRARGDLATCARGLHAVSPLATLGRGYAILRDEATGRVVASVADAGEQARVRALLRDGELELLTVAVRPGRTER
ncbi:MAG TPA: exodeoxyribonuclease VII large subunit, partial [Xanthomonadales bacterium]|nr:exodeoxyribonuclease VII large subunit [Xanthomonadales bacterium]